MPIVYGAVGAPSNTSAADGSNLPLLQGKSGEGVVTELHGKWFTSAYRNRVFLTAGVAAGLSVPVSSSTAITSTLYNPLGSGVVGELITLNLAMTNATSVVSPLLIGMISGLTIAPTSLTLGTVANANGLATTTSNQIQYYTVATLASAATKFFCIGNISATTGAFPNYTYTFDGHLLLQPGSLITIVATAFQTSLMMTSMAWAEYPT